MKSHYQLNEVIEKLESNGTDFTYFYLYNLDDFKKMILDSR